MLINVIYHLYAVYNIKVFEGGILIQLLSFWKLSTVLSLFWKNKSRLKRSRCCVCVSVYPPIVARQRIGKNPLIVPRQRLRKNPPIVAGQRLGKNPRIIARKQLGRNVTAVTNTHATKEELLDASFLMWRLVLPRTSCLFKNNVSETGLCLRPQVNAYR
jgi:hypothetical protein